jgi:Notch-like protein
MVACSRGGGFDTGFNSDRSGSGDTECDDGTAKIINDLLNLGAAINGQTEIMGETSLHLAARYARADAAQMLLDAGAHPNAQDKMGRTPLHAAVAADAQGVFQVKIKNTDFRQ